MKKYLYAIVALLFGFCFATGLCVRALSEPTAVANLSSIPSMRIVLDAGHGGIDGGVVGVKTGNKESDVNLTIVYALKERLMDAGFAVTLTRVTDGGLYGDTSSGFKRRDMEKRKQIAEGVSPHCVISIHQNYYPSTSSRGGQVFYTKDREESERLASAIQTELNALYAKQGVKGRKHKHADYFMLRLAPPSVLVECGFLSNPKDDELLSDSNFCSRIADGIATGLLASISQA